MPTANTIVMSRADKFGLAQLHQLRGRVGRSHHQAYAYLMVPDIEGLTKQAQQRLEAIQQMEELGSGFYLAMHDLEIRGAGEVLGENQSGNMLEWASSSTTRCCPRRCAASRRARSPTCSPAERHHRHQPACAPPCCPTTTAATCTCACRSTKAGHGQDPDQIDGLLEEIVDRFGKLPPQGRR